ncbi:hypothetical protein GLF_0933 [Gluconobacter frateurii NBRC 101659]|nr:hypothetical protein GLF_0933 [Gluconobacter frateurii NBRC 101659]
MWSDTMHLLESRDPNNNTSTILIMRLRHISTITIDTLRYKWNCFGVEYERKFQCEY